MCEYGFTENTDYKAIFQKWNTAVPHCYYDNMVCHMIEKMSSVVSKRCDCHTLNYHFGRYLHFDYTFIFICFKAIVLTVFYVVLKCFYSKMSKLIISYPLYIITISPFHRDILHNTAYEFTSCL